MENTLNVIVVGAVGALYNTLKTFNEYIYWLNLLLVRIAVNLIGVTANERVIVTALDWTGRRGRTGGSNYGDEKQLMSLSHHPNIIRIERPFGLWVEIQRMWLTRWEEGDCSSSGNGDTKAAGLVRIRRSRTGSNYHKHKSFYGNFSPSRRRLRH